MNIFKRSDPLKKQLKELGVSSKRIKFVVGVISQADPNTEVTAEELVELLDKKTEDAGTKDTALAALRDVCVKKEIFPKSYYISPGRVVLPESGGTTEDRGDEDSDQINALIQESGLIPGSAVWVNASVHDMHESAPIQRTVTILRSLKPKIKELLYCDIIAWKNMSHGNVLPFLGLFEIDNKENFCMVVHPFPKGNIHQFIESRSGTNRPKLLAQAASGLSYLHSKGVKCGVIYPGNIMIDEDVMPLIGDFGTSYAIFRSMDFKKVDRFPFIEYIAPELKNSTGFGDPPTKEGDVYSFGKTVDKVFQLGSDVERFAVAQPQSNSYSTVKGCTCEKSQRLVIDKIEDRLWSNSREFDAFPYGRAYGRRVKKVDSTDTLVGGT